MARGLAWFGIGPGLIELLVPRGVARASGLRGREGLLRLFGLREIASGVLLPAVKRPEWWLRTRILGEALGGAVDGRLVVVPDASHWLHVEQPRRVNAEVLAFDEDAPVVPSGLAFGAAFHVACHWLAGPLLRLKPPEWREPPWAVAQHLVVHAVYGLAIAGAASAGARSQELP